MKPTRKWLENQIAEFSRAIWMNQGALNHAEWMLKNEFYVEEEVKGEREGSHANSD